MKKKVFIASPLFNERQIAVIQMIEEALMAVHIPFYSARLHSGTGELGFLDTGDKARRVYNSNIEGLMECNIVIVVLDYLLAPGKELFVRETVGQGVGVQNREIPVGIPDTGTVFELGFMVARQQRGEDVFVAGYTTRSKLNLMVTQAMQAVFTLQSELETWIAAGCPVMSKPWEGGEQ